jgi:cytochrome c-type biogenesis protein CcmH
MVWPRLGHCIVVLKDEFGDMTLWLLFVLMTAVAIAAVLWPLARTPRVAAGGNDVAVYRDQLDELERDRALGAIGPAEAEAARTEVSRRLIAAADNSAAERTATAATAAPAWGRRIAALVALFAIPVGAASLYLTLGSPDLPDQPLAERLAKVHSGVPMPGAAQDGGQGQSMEALVARVESYLDKNPDDGRGWEAVAPVYMRMGNFEGAVKARANALRLLGPSAEREADHGEALVALADGVVTADAKAAFDRSVKLDAQNVSARFYLGLAAEQEGRKADAIAGWRALLADAPPGATWPDFVSRAIARAEGAPTAGLPPDHPAVTTPRAGAQTAAAAAPPGAQANAAPDGTPAQQNEMIRSMVARLADRLKQNGSDVDGWIRLTRSYLVLGDPDKARAAAGDARQALGGDADKLRQLDDGLKDLGLGG